MEESLVFLYTIRMRLLFDHPTRPARLISAQLMRRHWSIVDGKDGTTSVISGDGVIGLFPRLEGLNATTPTDSYESGE